MSFCICRLGGENDSRECFEKYSHCPIFASMFIRSLHTITLFAALLFSACQNDAHPVALSPLDEGLISPIILEGDTTFYTLPEYFARPDDIGDIRSSAPLVRREGNVLILSGTGQEKKMECVTIPYGEYVYDIPVVSSPAIAAEHFSRITTRRVNGDTIFLAGHFAVDEWVVYLQNRKLPAAYLNVSGRQLALLLPSSASESEWSELRIWAFAGDTLSNGITIPLHWGKVIEKADVLNRFNRSADYRPFVFLFSDTVRIKFPRGFSAPLRYVAGPPVAAWERSEALQLDTVMEMHMCVFPPSVICDGIMNLYASPLSDVKTLSERVTDYFVSAGVRNLTHEFSDAEKRDYFDISHKGEVRYKEKISTKIFPSRSYRKNPDMIYDHLLQAAVFLSTLPGMPVASYAYPELVNRSPEYLSEREKEVRENLAALMEFRLNAMPLICGDYLTLREDKNIYAYLRSYFEQEVVVVLNREEVSRIIKLDLPPCPRQREFRCLLGGRFSCDNSSIIVEVPAQGVSVICN